MNDDIFKYDVSISEFNETSVLFVNRVLIKKKH